MISIVRLGHVAKWPFLMAWRGVLRTGLNSMAWYHCANSGLVIAVGELSTAGIVELGAWPGMLVRLTCHRPDVFD